MFEFVVPLLVLTGIGLILIEIFFPSIGVIGLIGLISLVLALGLSLDWFTLADLGLNPTYIIGISLACSLLGVAVMLLILKSREQTQASGNAYLIGQEARVLEWKDTQGRVNVKGENWQAYSSKPQQLQKNDLVHIAQVNDLKLKITPKV